MAATQTTIQFRSRKLKYSKKAILSNIENVNLLNSEEFTQKKSLKRCQNYKPISIQHDESSDESCSPTKIARQKKNIRVEDTSLTEATQLDVDRQSLPSREKEIEFLKTFLHDHLDRNASGSLYISGQPGTGKTACLSHILQLSEFRENFKAVYINCTMMKSAGSIYLRICKELQLKTTGTSEKACLSAIEKYLSSKHKMTLLVLDEIDQLDSKRQSVLYTVFEWAGRAPRLVLVGVANALDLTERTLPRLQARSLRPRLLHFPPYTKQQIVDIFTTKLASEDKSHVFSPIALQMLAAKISAISGDMRRALDIGRRVIELAKRNKFSETCDVNSMMNDATATVELKQVLEVLNNVYGTSQKLEANGEDCFPLQQKLLICSLILMLRKGNTKDIVVGKLYDVYKRVAESRNMGAVDGVEFGALCELVESRGALRLVGRGAPRARSVRLQWDEAEVAAALRDTALLANILNDTRLLAR